MLAIGFINYLKYYYLFESLIKSLQFDTNLPILLILRFFLSILLSLKDCLILSIVKPFKYYQSSIYSI